MFITYLRIQYYYHFHIVKLIQNKYSGEFKFIEYRSLVCGSRTVIRLDGKFPSQLFATKTKKKWFTLTNIPLFSLICFVCSQTSLPSKIKSENYFSCVIQYFQYIYLLKFSIRTVSLFGSESFLIHGEIIRIQICSAWMRARRCKKERKLVKFVCTDAAQTRKRSTEKYTQQMNYK